MSATAMFFDTRHAVMSDGNEGAGVRALCYDQQTAIVEPRIRHGMTVLDVGCGPKLPYDGSRAWMIGLDPSEASLAQNTDVDERICASATAIPLPDNSVDMVISFYAIHHMTMQTMGGSEIRADRALAEMKRVCRPGGEVLVFEMAPSSLAWWAEVAFWDIAKMLLGDHLDSCFWPDFLYQGADIFRFFAPWWTTFPPIFSLPRLKLPRFLFPFTPTLYRWKVT